MLISSTLSSQLVKEIQRLRRERKKDKVTQRDFGDDGKEERNKKIKRERASERLNDRKRKRGSLGGGGDGVEKGTRGMAMERVRKEGSGERESGSSYVV